MKSENKNTIKAVVTPTIRDLEWAAGFFEGEGSAHRTNSGSTTLSIAQVNKEPVERMLRLFGGSLRQYKDGRGNNKPVWLWSAHGARGRGIAMTLYSLLSEKRRGQIRAAIA